MTDSSAQHEVSSGAAPGPPLASVDDLSAERAVVLLVDDQLIIGEAVRRLVATAPDIEFHFCQDAARALETAAAVRPTVILQDLVMPGADGLDLVRAYREQEATRLTPLVVLSSKEEGVTKAEAFARGANDYIVKLPDPLELLARIRYHSRGYIALQQRQAAFEALRLKQEELSAELAKAAAYVRSLLPPPTNILPTDADAASTDLVSLDWRFVPSASLGGDAFDYFAIDDDHLALYLLDVCGHGVGPALLSVSVMNLLRSQDAGGIDRRDPGAVLSRLNGAFRMDQQGSMYFTIWYGVYRRSARTLIYSGGGHPPPLLMTPGPNGVEVAELEGPGLPVGVAADAEFDNVQVPVARGSQLLLYSDGAIELFVEEGRLWGVEGLRRFMCEALGDGAAPRPATSPHEPTLDALLARVRGIAGTDVLPDDLSVILARL